MEDALLKQQIEVLLDIQTKKFQQELQSLREELSRTKEELLKEVRSVRQDTPVQAPVAPQPVPVQAPAEPPPATESIDRNGVAPAEVSIEKIFYAGK
ncbi:hypothetical protein GOV11_03260 [Candidatus Woesearchaeota archaeon]|nr:hypothetical protein [Candidatus Woesearchaeota archaeon]